MIFLLKTFIYRVSIVKLTKLSKFEFEVRFLKNQKNYKNSSSPKFDQNFVRTESGRVKSPRVSLYLICQITVKTVYKRL